MKRIFTLAALFAAGCAAALTLGATHASAWAPDSLPPGWSSQHIIFNGASTCPSTDTIITADRVFSPAFCTDSPTYQADIDAFVNSHYSAPATTTAAATTTVPAVTTTDTAATTTTAPAAPPPPVQTVVGTTTVTVTAPLTPVEQSLSDQIAALAAQIQALTDSVSRLEKAGDASWLAFQQAVAGGADPAAAADQARGMWLNVVNQLGAFSP